MIRIIHHRIVQVVIIALCMLALIGGIALQCATGTSPQWGFFDGACWGLSAILYLRALEKRRDRLFVLAMRLHLARIHRLWLSARPPIVCDELGDRL